MIAVSACGGLANQMFQYAFYASLRAKGYDVVWDNVNYRPNKSATCETTHIQTVFPNVSFIPMPEGHFRMSYWKRRWNFAKEWIWLVNGEHYLLQKSFMYRDETCRIKGNCSFIGSWQCEKYFSAIRSELLHDFSFKPLSDQRNIDLAARMASCNSVAVHFRKGRDYTSELLFQDTCPTDYYMKAISYIKEHVDNPTFFVFTDNKAWAADCLGSLKYELIDWNPVSGPDNYLDMQMMSCARHNIIANSTYSWWAAWLNMSEDKIVVAPSIWFNPQMKYYNPNEVVPESWIKL